MTGPLTGPELVRGAGVAKMDCPRARPCLRSASAASAAARWPPRRRVPGQPFDPHRHVARPLEAHLAA